MIINYLNLNSNDAQLDQPQLLADVYVSLIGGLCKG